MKTFVFVFTFIFTLHLTAQTSYEKGMSKAFQLWQEQKNIEASQLFERIATAEKENWLPPYYLATVEIVSSFGIQEEDMLTAKLTRAKKYLDQADTLSEDNPEIIISYALLNTAYITFDGQKYGMTLSAENAVLYNKALEIAPENPRVVLSKAEWDMGSAKFFGKSLTPFCKDITRAIELFKEEQQTIPFYPYSGIERAEAIYTSCKKETSPE
ncbi:hypothetical protein Celal_3668 [Cellulophaga algicola DSM 14237]|uniref:Uncharacterized protein n=1 Tax=Cellulophaga algicola (strain DSM 14237 / IC166 / ACAM 630) TaxID=688270 RepID=E6X9W2_CELAD|nr:hypothetical protein [Cellulophaga algicola]ADV50923.1 hypothetical protein Celal_3668 [Cellulophaga algicola DSM 14237]